MYAYKTAMAEQVIPSGAPTVTARQPPPGTMLVYTNLESEQERDILFEQRVICSWGKDKIPYWREKQLTGERAMFWVTLPKSTDAIALTEQPGLRTLTRDEKTVWLVGHVSLDRIDTPSSIGQALDETLTKPDGSVLTISSLFVMPIVKDLRLGAFAMDQCEMMAQHSSYGSPNCIAITVNTLSSRYFPGGPEGPDGVGRWDFVGQPRPKMDNTLWYKRRGYKPYKEEIRYFTDSPNPDQATVGEAPTEQLPWFAIFLRKELGRIAT